MSQVYIQYKHHKWSFKKKTLQGELKNTTNEARYIKSVYSMHVVYAQSEKSMFDKFNRW